jgi:hypothetical protein
VLTFVLAAAGVVAPAPDPSGVSHVTVAAQPGRYMGWPANHGLWAWGDEMVVMYDHAGNDFHNLNTHTVDRQRPWYTDQARSTDGGRTWRVEPKVLTKPGPPKTAWNGQGGPLPTPLTEPLDFTHPDLALTFKHSHAEYGESYFYASTDRCKTWQGPYRLPLFGFATVNARSDYVVLGPRELLLFTPASKKVDNEDGTETFLVRTRDGGLTWELVTRVNRPAPKTGTRTPNFTIMPATVRLGASGLLNLARCCDNKAGKNWIEAWASDDLGATWVYRSRVDTGNSSSPPAATRLPGGEVVVTYGYRVPPFGVRARVSRDDGRSWGPEVVLRSDGGNFDLGYTRNALRPDGKMVTAYYYNTDPKGDRTIEATIWDPLAAEAK